MGLAAFTPFSAEFTHLEKKLDDVAMVPSRIARGGERSGVGNLYLWPLVFSF